MAERTGTRGGAQRPNRTGLVAAGGAISAPSAGSGASVAWGILARTAEQGAQIAHQRYDRQVAVQATETGVMDAIMGRVRRLDRSTTRGGAYMDAALSTTKLQAETNATVAMSDFYRENPNDPAALQQQIEDYAEGAVGEIAGIDPATAVELRAQIVTRSIPMINGAIANREASTAEAKKVALQRAEEQREVIIASNAPNVFSPDPENRMAASAAIIEAQSGVQSIQSEEAATGFLLERLTSGHDAAHIVNMQPELKTRLSAMISSAPEGIAEGLGVFSGFRSVERQAQLFAQSDRSGRMVARPGHSQHNHGNAADLSWNGKSLKEAPKNVQDWVHEHAAEFGLKFPMDYEPWHIETQETRGGEPFEGKVQFSGFSRSQQEVNDAVIGPGFKAYFRNQADKPQAYLDFINGKTELPMTLPDGREMTVNVRNSLSDKARGEVEADLRAQMGFETSLRDDAERQSAAEATERSDTTRAGFMTGILANGTEMTVNGQTIVAKKPTEQVLLQARANGDLDDGDYEDLLKALREPRPTTSDEDVKRNAFAMILNGEDPQGFIMANLARLSVDDAKQMVDYYGTRTNAAGTLDPSQKFYLDLVDQSFAQGMMTFDPNINERKVAAVEEARARMIDGEKPEDVYLDIKARSKFVQPEDVLSALGAPPFPRPRFSVADPVDGNRINFDASDDALDEAFANDQISETEYVRQKRLLLQWDDLQKAAAAEAAKPQSGKP